MAEISVSGVKRQAVKSVKWTVLREIVSRSISPIITLILARLLSPSDFGIVGTATIAIGFAQIFQDFGLGKTLIQRESDVEKSANIIFWINIVLAFTLYVIIFLSAPVIAVFFHEPKVSNVLRFLCVQIVISGFIVVHQSLLERDFQYKKLLFIRLAPPFIYGLISISLASIGYGVWALVSGSLSSAAIQALLFWKISKWRPQFSFDWHIARQLFSFSVWVFGEAFLGWLIVWGDSVVLGHFLGVKELGIYRTGFALLTLIFGIFFNPVLPVAYSAFSRLQSNSTELNRYFLKTVRMMASISLPIGIGLAVIAYSAAMLIFGEKWRGIEIVIGIIGLKLGMDWLVGVNPEVYRAAGRPDVNTKLLIINVLYYIPVYILAAPHGLFVFCVARFTVAAVSLFLHFTVAKKVLKLPFTYLADCIKLPLMGSLVMGIIVYIAVKLAGTFQAWHGWLKMMGFIALGVMSYLLVLQLSDRKFVRQSLTLVKDALK